MHAVTVFNLRKYDVKTDDKKSKDASTESNYTDNEDTTTDAIAAIMIRENADSDVDDSDSEDEERMNGVNEKKEDKIDESDAGRS